MFDWTRYGKIAKSYDGIGSLYFGNHEIACSFQLVQLVNGNLYALCKVTNKLQALFFLKQPSKLVGKTVDDRLLTFSENLIVTSVQDDEAIIDGQILEIKPLISQEIVCLKFPLTNLILDGQFDIKLGGYEISCKPIDNYTDAVVLLKASRGVMVTSELTVQANSVEEKDEITEIVNNICMLLTIARGCRISWLYYDLIRPDGSIYESFHLSAITKQFTSLTLIPGTSAGDTKKFIENTYDTLINLEDFWGLRNAINAYTDAKVEEDFLEARALKLVILMEHLKSQYLMKKDKEYILYPPSTFDSSTDILINIVKNILLFKFPAEDKSKLEMMANHVRGLNWFPFGRALSEICKCIGMPTNSKERRRFVEIRNELVHRFKFHPSYGTPWDQFAFLLTFLGEILLSILKYDGEFYDWTKLGHGEAKMRKKIDAVDVAPYTTG